MPSSSVAWRGTSPRTITGRPCFFPLPSSPVTSLISYQRAKAELLGLSAKGGLMERAERFILLGLCFIAGAVAASALVPALWVFFGLLSATSALGRFVNVWKEAEGPPPAVPLRAMFADADMDVTRRALARWHEGHVDSRWRAWREARAHRDTVGAPGPVLRRAAQPSGRWRARRAGVPSSRSGRIWRAGREARAHDARRPAAYVRTRLLSFRRLQTRAVAAVRAVPDASDHTDANASGHTDFDESEGSWVAYLTYRALGTVMQKLPKHMAAATAGVVALVLSAHPARRGRVPPRHARRVVGAGVSDAELAALTRRAFLNYGRYWFEGARLPALGPDVVADRMLARRWGSRSFRWTTTSAACC